MPITPFVAAINIDPEEGGAATSDVLEFSGDLPQTGPLLQPSITPRTASLSANCS